MRRITALLAAGLAIAALSGPASAGEDRRECRQDRREDRREWRHDQREDRREFRQESRHDRREFRQEGRADRREFRREHRQDRREMRREHRGDRHELRREHRRGAIAGHPRWVELRRRAMADGRVTPRERMMIRRAVQRMVGQEQGRGW